MKSLQPSKTLLAEKYHEFASDLDALYIIGNASGRIKFAQKWASVAPRIFGDALMKHDFFGEGEKSLIPRFEKQAEARRAALHDIIRNLDVRSLDHGTLKPAFARSVIDKVGDDIAAFLYLPDIIEKAMKEPPTSAAELGEPWDRDVEIQEEVAAPKPEVKPKPKTSAVGVKAAAKKRVNPSSIMSNPYAVHPRSPVVTEPYPYSDVIEQVLDMSSKLAFVPGIIQKATTIVLDNPSLKPKPKVTLPKAAIAAEPPPAPVPAFSVQGVLQHLEPVKKEVMGLIKLFQEPKTKPKLQPKKAKPGQSAAKKPASPSSPAARKVAAHSPAARKPDDAAQVPAPIEHAGPEPEARISSQAMRWDELVEKAQAYEREIATLAYVLPASQTYNPLPITLQDWTYLAYFLRDFTKTPTEIHMSVDFQDIGLKFIHVWPFRSKGMMVVDDFITPLGYTYVEENVIHDELIPDISFYLEDHQDLYGYKASGD